MKYFLILSSLIGCLSANSTDKNDIINNLLQQSAAKSKSRLPQKIGKSISVTDVKVNGIVQTSTYIFDISDKTLSDRALADKTTKKIINQRMSGIMKKDFAQRACKSLNNPMSLLAMGAIYKSNFYSSDKVLQFTYDISKKDCK